MQKLIAPLVIVVLATVTGCAATAPNPDDTVKFHVSDRAEKLLAEQGKTLAAMRGYDRDSELVCEKYTKTGSHISHNVCYTRAEMEQRRLNHQEETRRFSQPGSTCMEGSGGGGGGGASSFRGAAGGC